MKAARYVLCLSLFLVLAGCTPWATYPPLEGTVELNKPTLKPIPSLMAEAMRFAHDHYAADHPLVINLPPDTPAEVYDEVLLVLGEGRPMTDQDESAFHVRTVRVRGLQAEVDVIYPRMGRIHELATIRFSKKVWAAFKVDNTRLWRFEVEPPSANYVPPPAEPETEPAEPPAESGGDADIRDVEAKDKVDPSGN